jgi:hypothetical protein
MYNLFGGILGNINLRAKRKKERISASMTSLKNKAKSKVFGRLSLKDAETKFKMCVKSPYNGNATQSENCQLSVTLTKLTPTMKKMGIYPGTYHYIMSLGAKGKTEAVYLQDSAGQLLKDYKTNEPYIFKGLQDPRLKNITAGTSSTNDYQLYDPSDPANMDGQSFGKRKRSKKRSVHSDITYLRSL